MELGLNNRVALVTGASQNIGLEIAKSLSEAGVSIILVSRSSSKLNAALKELDGPPERHSAIDLDLEIPENIGQLKARLKADEKSPDIVVHNLGGSLGISDPFSTSDDWKRVWNFNLGIAIDLNRFLIPEMLSRNWGRILHLSTLSTSSFLGNAPYVSAKCALEGYVKTISQVVSRNNVIVTALAPGLIKLEGRYYANLERDDPKTMERYYSEHLPIGRMGSKTEIAKVATFLCSDHAAFMPGALIRVDGGGR